MCQAPNRLKRRFTIKRSNAVWVTNLTDRATAEGFLSLAALKDLYHGDIVGYALKVRMTKQLVTEAREQAIRRHKPSQCLIHHADRGSQGGFNWSSQHL